MLEVRPTSNFHDKTFFVLQHPTSFMTEHNLVIVGVFCMLHCWIASGGSEAS
jgi:hypothetical protein